MATVYRYTIPINIYHAMSGKDVPYTFQLELPKNAEILTVATQGNNAFMWCRVDPEEDTEYREFRLTDTGHQLGDDVGEHIKSFSKGPFVWHLFTVI